MLPSGPGAKLYGLEEADVISYSLNDPIPPVMVGRTVLTGGLETAAVAGENFWAKVKPLLAVTRTRSVLPTSPAVGLYEEVVFPVPVAEIQASLVTGTIFETLFEVAFAV